MASDPSLTQVTLPDGTLFEGRSRVPDRSDYFLPKPPHPDFIPQWQGHPTREVPVKKLTWTHKLAIDLMVEHPEWTGKDLADFFGHSPMWVSLVINSDAFQAKLAERREEILNPEVRASIEERFHVLAQASLSRLHQKLENPNASDNLVLRAVELSAKALGLGVRPPQPQAQVQVAIVVPPKFEGYGQ